MLCSSEEMVVSNMQPSGTRLILSTLSLLAIVAFRLNPALPQTLQLATRHSAWAQPMSVDGVPNLHKVTNVFYRSAQPTKQGFHALVEQLGIRTVISLRAFHSDASLAHDQPLNLIRIRINTWDIDDKKVVEALRALRHATNEGPVLLHCQHGADRTGLITALYRVMYEGWNKEDATKEMERGEFGYHAVWGNIPAYIRNVDVAELKRKVGVD
jgi:protein tyrosine/serine phosphatase